MSDVDVELLVVPYCPNEWVALSVLCVAFDRVGVAAQSVRTTVIASQEQAQERGFVGSPTILINGVDPFGAAGQSPAYACRVYAQDSGHRRRASQPCLLSRNGFRASRMLDVQTHVRTCLLYTSPSPRDRTRSRMP